MLITKNNLYYYFLIMISLVTINAQGLRQAHRKQLAFNYLQSFDIIMLQETHWTDDIQTDIERDWTGQILFNNGTDTARGVAILLHERLNASLTNTQSDRDGRILSTKVTTNGLTLQV